MKNMMFSSKSPKISKKKIKRETRILLCMHKLTHGSRLAYLEMLGA